MNINQFSLDGKVYEYEPGAKWARAIEIPIFKAMLEKEFAREDLALPIVLEVGNVMSNFDRRFGPGDHYDVLDLYEHAPGVLNYDATYWRPGAANYSLIISISTFEHIGQARYGGGDQAYQPMAAAYNLFTWSLRPGGTMLLSIPLKYRAGGDLLVWDAFPDRNIKRWFFRKVDRDQWRQVDASAARKVEYYGKPFAGANGLAILQIQKPMY